MTHPPNPPRRPTVLEHHGDERVDDYFWLRERDNPEVIAHLEAENRYREEVLAHLSGLSEQIFQEIRTRVQETDASAPVPKQDYEYFVRTRSGLQYAIHCRRPRGTPGLPDPLSEPGAADNETVLVDENALADDLEYFELGNLAISPDQNICAYTTDTTGAERFQLRFRNIEKGRDFSDIVSEVYYGLAWTNDSKNIFYTRPDELNRPYQVWRHELGTDPSSDVLVFEEPDEHFVIELARSNSGRFIICSAKSKLTSEVWLIDADNPTAQPVVVQPRIHGIEYDVEHHWSREKGDRLFILTNADGAVNFKLMVTQLDKPAKDYWEEVVAPRDNVRIEDVEVFSGFFALSERSGGLEHVRLTDLTTGKSTAIQMPDPVYSAWVGANLDFVTDTLRYTYTSLATPLSDFEYDVRTGQSRLVKQQPVLGGFDPPNYVTQREWAIAPDGTHIPISLVHRRDTPLDGSAPCLLYGYGSYEISIDPTFSASRLSLLDRGFVFAIAHIRGGGELGREWYEDGKFEHKTNTFTDFIACAEHLVTRQYTSPDRLAARGGSAGGLLMGAVANLRPDLFRAIVSEVPFVDSLTTMLDLGLPLTVTEFEEWGNPVENPAAYAVMKSYSPYDNVRSQEYPAMYVSTGLNDPRVSYWEPVKWVAKLRAQKTDLRIIVLRIEMSAGHGGRSGRYDAWHDEAEVLAFLCDQLGAV